MKAPDEIKKIYKQGNIFMIPGVRETYEEIINIIQSHAFWGESSILFQNFDFLKYIDREKVYPQMYTKIRDTIINKLKKDGFIVDVWDEDNDYEFSVHGWDENREYRGFDDLW